MKFPRETNVSDLHNRQGENKGWLTVEESLGYFFRNMPAWYNRLIKNAYSLGVAHTREEVEANQKIQKKWMNPLETRLPMAPSLKIYCFYGMGKPTERAYYYREDRQDNITLPHIGKCSAQVMLPR